MKILYLAPLESIHTYKWIKFFKEKGHKIYCIGVEDKNNLYIDGVEYFLIKKYNIFLIDMIRYIIFTLRTIKLLNFDILHLHFIGKNAIPLLFLKNIKNFIITVWGSDILILPKKNFIYKLVVKNLLKKAKVITYDGNNMYKELLKYVDENKLVEIKFGIDINNFVCDKRKNNGKIKIISLRRLERIYSIDTIIKAVNLLIKNGINNFEVDIYGNGSELENLKNLVQKLELENYINFKGEYKYSGLKSILCNADIYISSSISDSGISASTKEAMAAGLLILTTDVGDNKLYIKNGKNGFLFTVNDYVKLYNILRKILLLSKEKILEIGKNNINIVKQFDITYNMNIVYSIYNNFNF